MDNELSLVKNSIFVSSVQRPVLFVLSSILLYNLVYLICEMCTVVFRKTSVSEHDLSKSTK